MTLINGARPSERPAGQRLIRTTLLNPWTHLPGRPLCIIRNHRHLVRISTQTSGVTSRSAPSHTATVRHLKLQDGQHESSYMKVLPCSRTSPCRPTDFLPSVWWKPSCSGTAEGISHMNAHVENTIRGEQMHKASGVTLIWFEREEESEQMNALVSLQWLG